MKRHKWLLLIVAIGYGFGVAYARSWNMSWDKALLWPIQFLKSIPLTHAVTQGTQAPNTRTGSNNTNNAS